MGRIRRPSYFSRMAQIGNTTRCYSPQLVSHLKPTFAHDMSNVPTCEVPTLPNKIMSQSRATTARPTWPLIGHGPPLLAVPRNTKEGLEIMGWGFSWSCPQSLHTTLPRYCEYGVMVALGVHW